MIVITLTTSRRHWRRVDVGCQYCYGQPIDNHRDPTATRQLQLWPVEETSVLGPPRRQSVQWAWCIGRRTVDVRRRTTTDGRRVVVVVSWSLQMSQGTHPAVPSRPVMYIRYSRWQGYCMGPASSSGSVVIAETRHCSHSDDSTTTMLYCILCSLRQSIMWKSVRRLSDLRTVQTHCFTMSTHTHTHTHTPLLKVRQTRVQWLVIKNQAEIIFEIYWWE